MKKKLKRTFQLKRETLRSLTPEMIQQVAGGTSSPTVCNTVCNWTESPHNISCQLPTACGGPTDTTEPGCGPSCDLVVC